MNAIDIILLNFEEARRRSIKLWNGIPEDSYNWKPDRSAMTCLEMVAHVLEGEHLYHMLIKTLGNLGSYESPWTGRSFMNLLGELNFCNNYRTDFIEFVRSLS